MNLFENYTRIVVTGGSGFIGGTLIRRLLNESNIKVVNLDKVALGSNLDIHNKYFNDNKYQFYELDLSDLEKTKMAIKLIDPDMVFHLAAESHVDKSISGPKEFIDSNVIGTFNLLEAVKNHWELLPFERKDLFRLIHVSTDEVFGSLGEKGLFSEESPYNPSSPYSASKASSDHLVKSWYLTYGLPVIITNSSNNFGPWQLPEKLIPVVIIKGLSNKPIPIYGDGKNIRDWIYVEDHVDALLKVALNGRIGDSYCIGGGQEKSNNEIVEIICEQLDIYNKSNAPHNRLRFYIRDRLGHDKRYAIDNRKIREELNWKAKNNFKNSLSNTVEWYIENINWCNKYIK